MADPKKNKREKKKESAQTHVKRSQASHRRIRQKGRFGAGPHHPLASRFHTGAGHRAEYKGGQQELFDDKPYRNDEEVRRQRANERAENDAKDNLSYAKKRTTTPKRGRARDRAPEDRAEANDWNRQDYVDSVLGTREEMLWQPDATYEAPGERRRGANSTRGGDVNGAEDTPEGFSEYGGAQAKRPWSPESPEDTKFIPMTDTGDFPAGEMPAPEFQKRTYERALRDAKRSEHMSDNQAEEFAQNFAAQLTAAKYSPGETIRIERMKEYYGTNQRVETPEERHLRVDKDELWKTRRGTLHGSTPPDASAPIDLKKGASPTFVNETMGRVSPGERDFITQSFEDQSSPFYGYGSNAQANKNLGDYLALREQGWAGNEALDWLQSGRPTSYQAPRGKKNTTLSKDSENLAMQDMEDRHTGKVSSDRNGFDVNGVRDKYASSTGTHQSFSYSMQAAGVDSLEDMRKRFPSASDADIVRFQQAQREKVDQHMLASNERWAHETRSARVRGKGDGANIEDEDRVVVLTTNTGAPTVTVPANNLVGQYIIKKRKSMVVNDRQATRKQVKGEFPKAVRDQHLIEVSTGISLGIEGRGGVFHNTGWKVGNNKSKGYGNKAPVGASVLRDSTGAPIYDKDGNVRYTEGYSRPFSVGTDKDVGLRIFIG